jgi:hypothetical protein
MFFGFNPSKEVAQKLREMADDDERTQQIIAQFAHLDETAHYAYMGQIPHPQNVYKIYSTVAVKKELLPTLMSLVPPNLFVSPRELPEMRYVERLPEFNEFIGPLKNFALTPAIRKSKLEEFVLILQSASKPIFIFRRHPEYYLLGLNSVSGNSHKRVTLPPQDLELLDHFPYIDQRHREFVESREEHKTPDDFLIEYFKRHY